MHVDVHVFFDRNYCIKSFSKCSSSDSDDTLRQTLVWSHTMSLQVVTGHCRSSPVIWGQLKSTSLILRFGIVGFPRKTVPTNQIVQFFLGFWTHPKSEERGDKKRTFFVNISFNFFAENDNQWPKTAIQVLSKVTMKKFLTFGMARLNRKDMKIVFRVNLSGISVLSYTSTNPNRYFSAKTRISKDL